MLTFNVMGGKEAKVKKSEKVIFGLLGSWVNYILNTLNEIQNFFILGHPTPRTCYPWEVIFRVGVGVGVGGWLP